MEHPPPLLSSKRHRTRVREDKPRAPLRTLPSVVISTRLPRRPRRPRLLPSPSRVPRSGKTSAFRFAGGPPSAFCPAFTRISAGWDGTRVGAGVQRVTRGRVGPPSRARRAPAGSPVVASLVEGVATSGWPGQSGSPNGPPCDFETGAPDRS